MHVEMIKNSALGSELSDEQCALLGAKVTTCSLKDREFLVQEGDEDDTLHVIVKGRLEVLKQTGAGDWLTLNMLSEGDLAGELGFLDGLARSAALRAVGDCEVFCLKRSDFEALLSEDCDLVYKVMRSIVRTVYAILRRMNSQHVEMNNYILGQHGRY
ncbi:MAG: cyclic nucleotide-binding domain-containing protein [Gammaproteobacteria bacterium]|nr:cyclic nucleotide-binding domain-containing protein [Gammaproteobacteria bacterium]